MLIPPSTKSSLESQVSPKETHTKLLSCTDNVFSVTALSIKMRNLLIDHVDKHIHTRLLFRVGYFAFGSNIVSETSVLSFKINFRDISVRISNKPLSLSRSDFLEFEQFPINACGVIQDRMNRQRAVVDFDRFIDINKFVTMVRLFFYFVTQLYMMC